MFEQRKFSLDDVRPKELNTLPVLIHNGEPKSSKIKTYFKSGVNY